MHHTAHLSRDERRMSTGATRDSSKAHRATQRANQSRFHA